MATYVDQQEYVYWLGKIGNPPADKIAISKLDASAGIDSRFSGPPAGKAITLFVVRTDNKFVNGNGDSGETGIDENPLIPEEFCDAVVAKAVQKGYERKMSENPQFMTVAQYWMSIFESMVKEGKKYANRGLSGVTHTIRPVDY